MQTAAQTRLTTEGKPEMALKASNDTISIAPIDTGVVNLAIIGNTPLYHHAMAEKARRTLLLGGGKKTSAEKAANVKHDPVEEYRASCYKIADDTAPTLIAMPAPAFKGVMRTAALDLPGTKRTEIGRLCWIQGYSVGIYGVPRLSMSVVRSADMARTPDIRTRAVMTEWACVISVSYVKPKLNQTSVVNLIAAGGITCGIGDWRQEKGSGSHGQFRIVGPNDKDFERILKNGGRAAQQQALAEPECYDAETEDLFAWYEAEIKRTGRGLKAVA